MKIDTYFFFFFCFVEIVTFFYRHTMSEQKNAFVFQLIISFHLFTHCDYGIDRLNGNCCFQFVAIERFKQIATYIHCSNQLKYLICLKLAAIFMDEIGNLTWSLVCVELQRKTFQSHLSCSLSLSHNSQYTITVQIKYFR